MSTVEERVFKGVTWLNENLGPDWPEFIDREEFNIRWGERCPLGQAFGSWSSAVAVLAPFNPWKWSIDHGFFFDRGEGAATQAEWEKYLDGYELLSEVEDHNFTDSRVVLNPTVQEVS